MNRYKKGFTLIELIAVIIIIGVLSVSLYSRFGSATAAGVQASRDDIIAALFYAQQTAMARSGVVLTVAGNSVNVTENGNPLRVHSGAYPLALASGVTVTSLSTPLTFTYNKLGKITTSVPASITLSRGGVSATITVEASGYAHY